MWPGISSAVMAVGPFIAPLFFVVLGLIAGLGAWLLMFGFGGRGWRRIAILPGAVIAGYLFDIYSMFWNHGYPMFWLPGMGNI
jgi:hypothetical protein